ncbi:uncharacterized protein BKCO1_7200054 [Diplodia corticola]|uniref:Uncharacterized protein n=1 Tax=Diplodia corticola TaxID=236234 RepID=A0A1J9RPG9_9PEZI|nr:uncharacterized protein BKCO1_7200054 [Diplodia corticola]OJD29812.1 hypothetical protein BKCO1_7200054 [Diplodia corticola]
MAEATQLAIEHRPSPHLHERTSTHRSRSEATLLGLPTEIRLYIFAYLLPDKGDHWDRCACHNSEKDDCELSVPQQREEPCGYLAVMLSCRTVFNEAVDMLYKPFVGSGGTGGAVPHLFVDADTILMTGYPQMFCRTHLTYRDGTAGVFQRIRKLHIVIESKLSDLSYACDCCEWRYFDPKMSLRPFGLDDKSQALDNVRWLAEQLSGSDGFDQLAITMRWDRDDEVDEDDLPELLDSRLMMKPFKALRNVKELKIGGLGTFIEELVERAEIEDDTIDAWKEILEYKNEMRVILGSNAPVNENPIPLSTWLSFKQIAKRLMEFAPQVGAQKFVERASKAMNSQDKKVFQRALNELFSAWKDEQKQRKRIATQFSELRQATFLDIPAGKRKEDDPDGILESSPFSWANRCIDKEDRAYINFLQSINK